MSMIAGYMPIGLTGVYVPQPGQVVPCHFYMPCDYYEQIQEESPWIFDDLHCLEQLINVEPEGVIFRNLKRDGHEHDFCYSCRPANAVQSGVLTGFVSPPPSHSFSGPVLFWVEWREEVDNKPCYPVRWEEDFGEVIWTRQ